MVRTPAVADPIADLLPDQPKMVTSKLENMADRLLHTDLAVCPKRHPPCPRDPDHRAALTRNHSILGCCPI
jgi:hypothetical protein